MIHSANFSFFFYIAHKLKLSKLFSTALSLLFISLLPFSAFAWDITLENNAHLPENFIAISKEKGNLYVVENRENFEIKQDFPAISGEIDGDKVSEGDLRTPEGVYFITTQIRTKLDFEKYGSGAFALNYPNPVDRIKQKTGFGIWIHSKGDPIKGQVTQGCVAVDLDDFETLSNYLPNGIPVIVASTLEKEEINSLRKADLEENTPYDLMNEVSENRQNVFPSQLTQKENREDKSLSDLTLAMAQDFAQKTPEIETLYDASKQVNTQDPTINTLEASGKNISSSTANEILNKNLDKEKPLNEADLLVELTKKWNKTWSTRSEDFFALYEPEKYTLAHKEGFESFRVQKRYLFSMLPWIHIIHGKIYALKGTDYWVTWFEQRYQAPNLTTEGTRRLYWQKDTEGQYKVVAMEWFPAHVGLEEVYMASTRPEIEATIEGWKAAWLSADIEEYASYYIEDARQGRRKGQEIFDQKTEIWAYKKPEMLEFSQLEIRPEGRNIRVRMRQRYLDSTGYSDYGIKEILFIKLENTSENNSGKEWRIAWEDWRNL